MQLCNLTLRLGGSLLHTVPKTDVTPGEILILRAIHGDDACVDIRPTRVDHKMLQNQLWERLAGLYDGASAFQATPGEESKSIMRSLFPGAMRKLPTTLEEIGLGHLMSDASIKAAEAGHGAAAIAQREGADMDFTPAEDGDNGDGQHSMASDTPVDA